VASAPETDAMARAVAAASVTSARGPNPRVACVLLDGAGQVIATGIHRGAGTPHAEVDALAGAGTAARGATAVVTLEPCSHSGRTGPCTEALIAAGVRRVVFGQVDPNPAAAGGARALAAAGVDVEGGILERECADLNRRWSAAVARSRPWVIWKVASTLDGRIAAADGSSRWITSDEARADVHALRSEVDAIVVGTGTALIDAPSLTARTPDGSSSPQQPLRVVVGERPLPAGHPLTAPDVLHLRTHSPERVLADLQRRDVRTVLLEGGPTLAAGFLAAGVIDEVWWYVAPALLGAGAGAVADLGITAITGARRLRILELARVGADVKIVALLDPAPGPSTRGEEGR
jgi:diaminohydroxyphosphoribosylaminopyrimidine deaminase/5-amino-6-(5-phosphoribosylamino)uracil reductase